MKSLLVVSVSGFPARLHGVITFKKRTFFSLGALTLPFAARLKALRAPSLSSDDAASVSASSALLRQRLFPCVKEVSERDAEALATSTTPESYKAKESTTHRYFNIYFTIEKLPMEEEEVVA